jgi:magnesium transporter
MYQEDGRHGPKSSLGLDSRMDQGLRARCLCRSCGIPPGWVADTGLAAGKEVPEMIIDCAHYQGGRRREEGAVPLQEAAARCEQGGFVWLGLFEPGEQELAQVRDTFGLHELAVEDAQNFHMRPKIENYDHDVRLVILRTARYDDDAEEVQFGEISVFLAPAFVITVRQGVASELREARRRLEQRPELLAAGSSSALWAILDQVVDGYAPVVAGLERDIDQIEATVFSGAVAPTERIYSLRREATDFYRAVHPLLAVVTTVERAAEARQLQPYLRDVQDHLLLVNEEVAAQRDLLGTVLEANMAVISVEQTKVSVRQNATIEQLTILATVFLPLTFVTGFFGQNFAWLVRHIDGFTAFAAYGIGGLAVPLVLLFLWLRLRRLQASTGATNPARPTAAAKAATGSISSPAG